MGGYNYYSEQEYQDEYDYDDEILVNDVDDATIPSHRPTIISDSVVLNVDNGMTIRLPCIVDKLSGEQSLVSFLISLSIN